MANICGCSDGFKYSQYSSKDPELNLAIDYIAGWRSNEHKGENKMSAGLLFFEDKKGDVFKALISVNAIKASKIKVDPSTIEAMANSISESKLNFKDGKILSRSRIKVLATEAIELDVSYKTADKIYAVDSKYIPVKERIVIFKKGDKFYTIRYENKEEDFDKLNKAFDHIVRSLKFKDAL